MPRPEARGAADSSLAQGLHQINLDHAGMDVPGGFQLIMGVPPTAGWFVRENPTNIWMISHDKEETLF